MCRPSENDEFGEVVTVTQLLRWARDDVVFAVDASQPAFERHHLRVISTSN
jgi:hypothetical protein